MGLSEDAIGILSKTLWGWGREGIKEEYIREAGLDPDEPNLRRTLKLAGELIEFPRHLSQHTGGFVITKGNLSEIVPIENAAMDDRTVIEWDKNDLDILGMLKIDVLALGMLTCLRKGYELLKTHYGVERHLYDNEEDPLVYDMLCKGDSVGVFHPHRIEDAIRIAVARHHARRMREYNFRFVALVFVVTNHERPGGEAPAGDLHPQVERDLLPRREANLRKRIQREAAHERHHPNPRAHRHPHPYLDPASPHKFPPGVRAHV